MTVTFLNFLHELLSNPTLILTTLLTLGVVLVNGWTDAPNAIATCISTRSLSPRSAVIMAAVFNFLGVLVMTLFNTRVAHTIYQMVDFRGNPYDALVALCAALVAIVLWATGAWWFGIPTSESHALIAGISGAAIALQGGMSGINATEWVKVLYGLVLSTIAGLVLGFVVVKTNEHLCRNLDRRKANGVFSHAQIAGAAGMSFMHGAQDGQKFMGVFMLSIFLARGEAGVTDFIIPVWLMVLCSMVMALGTSIGGYRIIKAVGLDMVRLKHYQGFSADLVAVVCLLAASILGLPVSTTHTKTTAIMGVGLAKRFSYVNWAIAREMVSAWILTFPGCGLIGYLMVRLFMFVF